MEIRDEIASIDQRLPRQKRIGDSVRLRIDERS